MLNDPESRKILTLTDLALGIRQALMDRFGETYWIRAEMNKLNLYPRSGHCYPDLIERSEGRVVAEMRSVIWKDDHERINEKFLRVLKEPLRDGIQILFSARLQYSPVYGLSLRITDIDPTWSLGELEREKQETLARLKQEGTFDLNRSRSLALLPSRIAVISVETSKGYSDFRAITGNNPWGYAFFHMLFPALLQGDDAAGSILAQLNRIRKVAHHFDAVAIIRGGGGDVGLACYNRYDLAVAVATFPKPVLTGIGHSTNETVTEMVAFRNSITPTDLAGFLIQRYHNFSVPVREAGEFISFHARRILREERTAVGNLTKHCLPVARFSLKSNGNDLDQMIRTLAIHASFVLRSEKNRIAAVPARLHTTAGKWFLDEKVSIGVNLSRIRPAVGRLADRAHTLLDRMDQSTGLLDPARILRRGFSITLAGGKPVTSTKTLNEGDPVRTILADGSLHSIIQTIQPLPPDE